MSAVANVAINVDSRGAAGKLREVANRSKELEKAVQGATVAVSKTGRELKTAANGMQYFIDATGRARKANGQFVTTAEAAAAGIGKQGRAASQASAGFGKLGKAIGGIATAAAAFQALKFTIVKTAELETQTRSLKVLTGSLKSAQSIIKQLQDIGAVTPFTSTELIDTAKRLRAFGVETDKLVDTTRRLGDVAGATGADLGGIATAFGQIQAKGRLQGEELLQLQERGIDLQSELQKMYGMTGEEFRKALEKGQFSAEAVDVALQNLTNTGGKYANGAIAQSDTLAGKFSTLQDGITRTAQAIGQVLSPALQTILTQAIGVVNSINNALAAGRRIQQFGIDASKRNELFQQAGREAEEIARLRGGGKINPAVFTQLRDERFKDLIEAYGYETGQIQVETKAPTLETPSVPELLGGGGGGGGRGAASVAKEQQRAAEAAQRQAEAIAKGRLESEQLLERLNMQLAIEQEINPIKKIQLQNGLEQLEIQQRYGNLISQEEDSIRRINLERAGGLELQIANVRQTQDLVDKITEAGRAMGEFLAGQIKVTETTDQYKQLWEGMSSAVANTFSSALDAAVDGTKNLGEALQSLAVDLLKTISKMLIMYAIAEALGALGGGSSNPQGVFSFLARGFGFRANGGPVTGGSPYIVGERGPELFVPRSSGTIIPNDKMGGGVTVGSINISVENSGDSLSPAAQKKIAGQVQGIVLSTLANERRSGGML